MAVEAVRRDADLGEVEFGAAIQRLQLERCVPQRNTERNPDAKLWPHLRRRYGPPGNDEVSLC
jgi:hypothetical protein